MDLTNLEKNLGLKFQNQGFLKQALTHRSFPSLFPSGGRGRPWGPTGGPA